MDGFKDSTRMKYMTEGGTYNERGRRATMSEIAAEDRRMAGRPSEGVSSRPTDASGRRATDAELGMTNSAKKPVGPSSVAVSKVLAGMTKPMKKATGGSVSEKPMSMMPLGYTTKDQRQTVFTGDETRTGKKLATKGPPSRPSKVAALAAKVPPPKTLSSTSGSGSIVKPGPTPPQPSKVAALAAKVPPPKTLSSTSGSGSIVKPAPTPSPPSRPSKVAALAAKVPPPKDRLGEQMKGMGQGESPMGGNPLRGPKPAGLPFQQTAMQLLRPGQPMAMKNGGMAKKGVPAHSDRPMIGRKASGLAVMPKGKR